MSKTRPSDSAVVRIDSMSHDGRGIASLSGKTTFVSGALLHETVACQITKKQARYNEATVIDVITQSSERVSPHCAHFGVCGGCSLQHMRIDAQVHFKQTVLLEQLKHFGKVMPETVLPPIIGEALQYRRKARLGVRYVKKKNKVLVGFREKNSNFLADIETCPILHKNIGSQLIALAQLIQGLSQFDQIPQIEVAISENETALVFRHLAHLSSDDILKLKAFGKENQMHIYLQPHSPDTVHLIWPELSSQKLTYLLPDYQLEMHFHPLDFIQVNGEVNQLLLKKAMQLLDPKPTDIILDLFCGLGNFTLPIARYAKEVVGVEGSADMINRANENAKHNGILNATFYANNLMDTALKAAWLNQSYHKILLDPPRAGAKEIIPQLSHLTTKKIVYVSCNPATLARDAGELVYQHGYRLSQVGVINMFPHTSHIEAIALFEK